MTSQQADSWWADEPRILAIAGACKDWQLGAALAVAGVAAGLGGAASGATSVLLLAGAVILMTLGIGLGAARDYRNRRVEEMRAGHAAEAERYITWLLRDRVSLWARHVGEVVATDSKAKRAMRSQVAKRALVEGAADVIGAARGTRANLFTFHSSPTPHMKLEPLCHAGRGDQSSRVFEPGDLTYDLAMDGKARFALVSELPEAEQDLRYAVFMAYPVFGDDQRIRGLLSVDCVNAEDLNEDVDTPAMATLAHLLAIAYESERFNTPPRGE